MADLNELDTFDLLDAVSGKTYPTSTTVIYFDLEAMNELGELDQEIASLDAVKDEEKESLLLERREQLIQRIKNASLSIEMKGLPRSLVNAMINHVKATVKSADERNDRLNMELVVRSITKIADSEGRIANFGEEELEKFLSALRVPQWQQLINEANNLSMGTLKYETEILNPNFS